MSDDAVGTLLQMARRAASRWSRSTQDADDVAQEALIRLLVSGTHPVNAAAWLYVVTRRLSNRRRLRDVARTNAELSYLSAARIGEPSADLLIDMDSALRSLPCRDRSLLTHVVYGAVASEIAREFGCEVRDVGQMVARARRKMRRFMATRSSS
jgi:RNA polymerase sigma factor (sigma-70 family)